MNSFTSDTDVEEKTDNALSSDIVGGMFGLDVMTDAPVAQPKFFGDEGSIFLANARSGINLLIRELNPAQVWFPSYLCNVMLGAVDQGAASIRFYEIDYDLKIQSREWIKGVLEGDLVIFIDYFGLYKPKEIPWRLCGGIQINRSKIPLKVDGLTEPSRDWWLKSLTASVMRREFDICSGNRESVDRNQGSKGI